MNYTTPQLELWRDVSVYGKKFTPELKMIADAIDRLDLWKWIRTNPPKPDVGYQLWQHPNLKSIACEAGSEDRHSGATFAFAMRNMQYIAKNGFDKWNQNNQKYNKQDNVIHKEQIKTNSPRHIQRKTLPRFVLRPTQRIAPMRNESWRCSCDRHIE